MRTLTLLITLALLSLSLAACGTDPTPAPPDSAAMPTLMDLPTLTATPPATPTSPHTPTLTLTPSITLTPSETATSTVTPSLTITNTATRTPTLTPSEPYVPGPLDFLAELARTATVLPPGLVPTGGLVPTTSGVVPLPTVPGSTPPVGTSCPTAPAGGFAAIYFNDASLPATLGCPLAGDLIAGQPAAIQNFQTGQMLWVSGAAGTNGLIYVLFADGRYRRFSDTYVDGEPIPAGTPPPDGLIAPVRGFGKVWRDHPDVQSGLGWATGPESGSTAARQGFERGAMLNVVLRGDVLILADTVVGQGTWRPVAGAY